MRVKKSAVLALLVLAALLLGYAVAMPRVHRNLAFFWSDAYNYIIYASLASIAIAILLRKTPLAKYLKHPTYFIFLPLALFPVMRCNFKIPYIFCKVCPRKCPWGAVRQVTIPSFVLFNLDARSWCFRFCPFGTLQECQAMACKKRVKLPGWLSWLRYPVLLFTIAIVVLAMYNIMDFRDTWFFRANYQPMPAVIATAAVIFLLSFVIPRLWCSYLCPIGSLGDIILRLKKQLFSEAT